MAAALIAGALLIGGGLVAFGLSRQAPNPQAPNPQAPAAEQHFLAVGDKAPDFSLPAANGKQVRLSQYLGKSNVLLFFSMGTG